MFGLVAVSLVLAACVSSDPPLQTGSSTTAAPTQSTAAPLPVDIDVQGHRGARGLQPENTLSAFEIALDLGVDTLELDLHFTADGEVVIWHDPIVHPDKCRLDPAFAGDAPDPQSAAEADIAIARFTRAELEAYRCDLNPDSDRFPDQEAGGTAQAGDSYRIVTLAELFDFVATYAASTDKTSAQQATAATVLFNVETKRVADNPATINDGFDGVTPGPFELTLLQLITEFDLDSRVVVQSFDHRSLRAIRSVNDTIQLAALTSRNVPFSAEFAEFANVWSPDNRSVSASSLEDAHAAGLQVIPWTVNEASDMSRLIVLGVDGLITDRPDILVAVVAEGG
ncbi:MAG: hypothetical protein GY720_08380 [bacterium]|nr:hypothetical protein [bacterium]